MTNKSSMKRFWTFHWQDHDALGGMHDFRGSFDSLEEAKAALNPQVDPYYRYDSWQIFDTQTQTLYDFHGGEWRVDPSWNG
jgi:hypothetical protein